MVIKPEMVKSGNFLIDGLHKRPILADYTFLKDGKTKPIIIFSHGFKGFKDWGHFNLMAEQFALNGFVFLKFNFSHNGTTADSPVDFADLEAFAENNFTKELDDLGTVIDWVEKSDHLQNEIQHQQYFLIGHSRGGSISLLKSREDSRIKKLVTWASPSTFENKFNPDDVKYWKDAGVIYVENSRTNQKMPLKYQIVEDYFNNKHRTKIELAAQNLLLPSLFVQGTADDVITLKEAEQLHLWHKNSELLIIENGDHTFGTMHPFLDLEFPDDFKQVFEKTCDFLKSK
jgi:uncharacterized protein